MIPLTTYHFNHSAARTGRGKDFMYGDWKLRPETAADVDQESTIQGKRQRIYRYSRENSMVRCVLRAAESMGLSGEDTMTWLAYEALKRVEHMEEITLEYINTHPGERRHHIISTAPKP